MGVRAKFIEKELDTLNIESTKIGQEVRVINRILTEIEKSSTASNYFAHYNRLRSILKQIQTETKKQMIKKCINHFFYSISPIGIVFTSTAILEYLKSPFIAQYGEYIFVFSVGAYLIYLPFSIAKSILKSSEAKFDIEQKIAPAEEIKYINSIIKNIKESQERGKYEEP
jgi:hypothetical protein